MAVGGKGYGAGTRTVGQFKDAFFDPSKVIKGMDRAAARALSRFGAFVRQSAKTSIRYREKPALPGQPPSAHRTGTRLKKNRKTGVTKRQPSSPLRDLIFFAYDREKKEVIIGPAIFPAARSKGVPPVLEYGGTEAIPPRGKRRGRTARYAAHPFMRPARDKNLPQLMGFFKNSL